MMEKELKRVLEDIENGEITASYVVRLLETYYYGLIYPEKDLDIAENLVTSFPEELTQPLDQRISGIGEAMQQLIGKGYGLNEFSEDSECALTLSVGGVDAPMTEWLLQHGADPHIWPDMSETAPWEQNYYLDDLDIHFQDDYTERISLEKSILDTVRVIAVNSDLRNYSGFNFSIDSEGNVMNR